MSEVRKIRAGKLFKPLLERGKIRSSEKQGEGTEKHRGKRESRGCLLYRLRKLGEEVKPKREKKFNKRGGRPLTI